MHIRYVKKYLFSLSLFLILISITGTAQAGIGWTNPPACPATLTPSGSVGTAYSFPFGVSGGGKPTNPWSITAGSLPPGLLLDPAGGVLSGTPTTAGSYTFTVTYTGTGGNGSSSCACTLDILLVSGGGCAFVGTNTGSITFAIDPSTTPGPIYSSGVSPVLFTCDPTVTYSFTTSPVIPPNQAMIGSGGSIPFTLQLAPPAQNVTSTTQISLFPNSPPTASSVALTDYQSVPAGSYNSGTIQVNIGWTGGSSTGNPIIAYVTASGTVTNICKASTPGTLTFAINPAVTGTLSTTLSPDLAIQCTKGDTFTVTSSSACGGKMYSSGPPSCSGNYIPYTFTCLGSPTGCSGSGSGSGFGVSGTALGIGGSVNSADYENAYIGTYQDTQTLTIQY